MSAIIVEFDEMGGYDCTSAAFIIRQGSQTLAEVDLRHFRTYGEGTNASLAKLDQIARARKIAETIAAALNEESRGNLL